MSFYFSRQEQDRQIADAIIEKVRCEPANYLNGVGLLIGRRLFSQLVIYATPLRHVGESDKIHSYDKSYHYGQLIGMDIILRRNGSAVIADVCSLPPLESGARIDTDDVAAAAKERAEFYLDVATRWLGEHAVFNGIASVAAESLRLPESHHPFVMSGIGFAAFLGDEAPNMLMNENIWPVSLERFSSN